MNVIELVMLVNRLAAAGLQMGLTLAELADLEARARAEGRDLSEVDIVQYRDRARRALDRLEAALGSVPPA